MDSACLSTLLNLWTIQHTQQSLCAYMQGRAYCCCSCCSCCSSACTVVPVVAIATTRTLTRASCNSFKFFFITNTSTAYFQRTQEEQHWFVSAHFVSFRLDCHLEISNHNSNSSQQQEHWGCCVCERI